MAPLVYVMAILGCGDDGAACTRERIAPATYSSIAECNAAMPTVLAGHTDLSFPVISAACQRGRTEIAQRPKSLQRRNG
jgi:hypothetical protein